MRFTVLLLALLFLSGCRKGQDEVKVGGETTEKYPIFSLATSEYPSWSTFMVAGKAGLINPKEGGEPGVLEKKWKVDIVLHVKDYDPCITLYGSGGCDAVCITNMDALNPALGRSSTTILPTSTSAGADKVIGVDFPGDTSKAGISSYLKGKKTFGLSKSVSEYVFVRGLEKLGLNPEDYPFVNLEPGPAATALQTGSDEIKSICVWNPFALQTVRTQKRSSVIFDSSLIPEEIIDMVVIGNDSLKKDGGDRFASCICDMFYDVSRKIDSPKSGDATLKALGEDFSNLSVADMRICTKETFFYKTPEAGIALFSNPKFVTTMKTVVTTSEKIGVLERGKAPSIGMNDTSAQLNFSTTYMKRAAEGK